MATINIPRHPDIERYLDKYKRIRVLIENDEDCYDSPQFCLPMPNEQSNARKARKELFKVGFRNITNDLLGSCKDMVFKIAPRLEFKDENGVLSEFSKDVTRGNDKVDLIKFCRDFCTISLRGYGMVWTIIDKPNYQASSFMEELKNGLPYITNISPLNVWNYEICDSELKWFAYKCEYFPEWEDPTAPQPIKKQEIRIWTKEELIITENGNIKERFPHSLGIVPVVWQSFYLPPDSSSIVGIAPFFTTSNLIIMANNMKSVADMELAKHGNSVLLVQENAISAINTDVDEDGVPISKLQDAKGFNQFVYSGDKEPMYLTKELSAVSEADKRAQMYFDWAYINEKTLRSILKQGADGGDVSESGVSKAFDIAPVLSSNKSTADDLESWCKKVLQMVGTISGIDPNSIQDQFTCEFNKDYDVSDTSFDQQLTNIEKMQKVEYPSIVGMKEAFKGLTVQLTPNKNIQETINAEIDESELEDDTLSQMLNKDLNGNEYQFGNDNEDSSEDEE